MKKLILIMAVCTLLICASCGRAATVDDPAPPLGSVDDPVSSTDPHENTVPETSEPDIFAPHFKPPVSVEMLADTYESGDIMKYIFINRKDAAVSILNIPKLFRVTQNGVEQLMYTEFVGFCGTPDCLAANSTSLEWELDAVTLYGHALEPGQYVLSFKIVDENYEAVDILRCDFTII